MTTAFEMRHTVNGDADNGDLGWMRLTMGIYGPHYIAMNYSVGSHWRYADSVHHDVLLTTYYLLLTTYYLLLTTYYLLLTTYYLQVHHDVAYLHTHCPQPNYTMVCSGHYSEIPAKGGICGFRAFWSRITRKAFGDY